MTAQRLYTVRSHGRTDDVQRIAPVALAFLEGSARRHVLYTTVLVASYLPAAGNPHSDIDRVCELLGQALPSLGSLHSTRSLERFNAVRRALAAHPTRPSVHDFEDRFRTTVMAVDTRACATTPPAIPVLSHIGSGDKRFNVISEGGFQVREVARTPYPLQQACCHPQLGDGTVRAAENFRELTVHPVGYVGVEETVAI